MARILVADDDCALTEMIAENLRALDHVVEVANHGDDAEDFAKSHLFDLLILDWNMPGKTGVDICCSYRQQGKSEPILLLTAKSNIADKEEGLYAGADDYLTKPFDLRELMARVSVLLRRPPIYVNKLLSVGDLRLDLEARTVSCRQKTLRFQPRELALLEFLCKRTGQVIGSEALLSAVWGSEFEGTEIALRSCLVKLRKALTALESATSIETVHGFGYRFVS